MNFSKVLYFPSSHCQLSLSHRLIFFRPLLWASAGVGAEKPIIPATPAVCPRLLWGTFQGHEIISSVIIFTFFFYQSAVDLTPVSVAVQLFFFFSFQKGNVFRFVLQKKKKESKKKKKQKVVLPNISSAISMKIHFLSFYLFNLLLIYVFVGGFLRVQYQSAG